jgi:hypothetical protein
VVGDWVPSYEVFSPLTEKLAKWPRAFCVRKEEEEEEEDIVKSKLSFATLSIKQHHFCHSK